MQSTGGGECEDNALNTTESVRSNYQPNPEENNEVNYKWMCESCTYENWMAANCCTMCRATRQQMPQIISENNVNQGTGKLVRRKLSTPTIAEAANSDIFKLGTSASPPPTVLSCSPPNISSFGANNSRSSSPASRYSNLAAYYYAQQHLNQSGAAAVSYDGSDQNEQHQLKWSCAQCTYFNWPKSPKCIQCLSSRKRISPTVSRNSPVSPRPTVVGVSNYVDGSPPTAVNVIHENNSNNQHISSPSTPYRPLSISPPPFNNQQNIGSTFDSRTNLLEDSIYKNERNRNNSSPPHSKLQNRNMGKTQEKKTQYPLQKQDKNILLQNRVMSPPMISSIPSSNASTSTSSSPPPQSAVCVTVAKKWSCQACTYENWPKTKNCTICGCLRGSGKLPFIPENNRESPPAGAAASSRDVNIRNIRPPEPQNLRDSAKPRSPTLPTKLPQTSRNITQAEILTSSVSSSAIGGNNQQNNCDYERRLLQLRRRLREADWSWLSACLGVVEGDMNPVEGYLNSGGDPTRKLINAEVALLNRPESFAAGHTLVHLAIKFHREDMLATLLSQFDGVRGSTASNIKCVPSYVAPDLASAIRRHIYQALRQRKGHFPCNYICEWATYSLPPEIEDLPPGTQEQLYSQVMDRDAQKELEEDVEDDSNGLDVRVGQDESPNSAINWSIEICGCLGSRLYALWNRSAGDCLLDSVLQATWGVFDRDNALRRAMAESLHEAGHIFYPRWKAWESQQALELGYTLDESQLAEDWAGILSLASQPGASLEQIHVFCLAHVLRRPIIVYGVKYVKSWRGENLGFAGFEGVYLPLLWERSFCTRSPVALGYTRGHFCALVPPEPVVAATVSHGGGAGALLGASNPEYPTNTVLRVHTSNSTTNTTVQELGEDGTKSTYVPLVTSDRKQFLPIPYLNQSEMGNSESILRQWLDVRVTESGIVVAQQNHLKPPLLVAQLTEEWLNHYRKLAQSSTAPLNLRSANNQHYNYSHNNVGNNCLTSNVGQTNVTRAQVRRTSPTISQQTSVTTTTSLPVSSSTATHTTIVDTEGCGVSDKGITSSIISGGGGVTSNAKGLTSPNSSSNQVCYSSDADSDEE